MKKIIITILNRFYRIFNNIKLIGKNIYIGINCRFVNHGLIQIYENVKIRKNVFFICNNQAIIQINKNCDIGTNSRISCAKKIILEESVLIGPNVYIADQDHQYRDIHKPIMDQGTYSTRGIIIGKGTWIGVNCAIIGGITIRKKLRSWS